MAEDVLDAAIVAGECARRRARTAWAAVHRIDVPRPPAPPLQLIHGGAAVRR